MKLCLMLIVVLLATGFKKKAEAGSYLSLKSHISQNQTFQDCAQNELDYGFFNQAIFSKWRLAWLKLDPKKFNALVQTGAKVEFSKPKAKYFRAIDGINEYEFGDEKLDANSYLNQFKKISDLELFTEKFNVSKTNSSEENFVARVRFDLRGIDNNNQYRTDRGFFNVTATKDKRGYKITSIFTESGVSLVSTREPSFVNDTKNMGLADLPIHTRDEAIRRGGYALSVGRLEQKDNNYYLFVGTPGNSLFLKQNKSGAFEKVTDSAITNPTLVKAAVFADFDNNGKLNVVMTRFTPEKGQSDVVYFENSNSGSFVQKKDFILNRWQSNYSMPAAIGDFNSDGKLDIYVGFPGKKDFTNPKQSILGDIPTQGMFINQGKGNFLDVTKSAGLSWLNNDPIMYVFSHSAMAVDYNKDNKMDLLVMDDRGNISPIYKNMGDLKFKEASVEENSKLEALGMSVAVADTKNNGNLDILRSAVNFTAATRMLNSCGGLFKQENEITSLSTGLKLLRKKGNDFFDDTKAAGLDWAGEGLAGIEFLDYNNDGFNDLLVSNGLWSGNDREQDISSEFVSYVAADGNPNHVYGLPHPETPSHFLTLLKNFKGNFMKEVEDPKGPTLSMGGYQHKRLFRNNKDGTFTEVGYLEGIDSIADGYIIATADLNRDGRTDVILRNADPGTKAYVYPVVEVFKNQNKNNNSLSIRLKGDVKKGSNSEAIGATVEVHVNGIIQTKMLIENNGPSQSDRALHFGLADNNMAEKVIVRFPSGATQKYFNVPKGEFWAVEGENNVIIGNL